MHRSNANIMTDPAFAGSQRKGNPVKIPEILMIETVHQPGSLAKVLKAVAVQGGNVVQVNHHREGFELPFGHVAIEIAVETRDAEHAERIGSALEKYRR